MLVAATWVAERLRLTLRLTLVAVCLTLVAERLRLTLRLTLVAVCLTLVAPCLTLVALCLTMVTHLMLVAPCLMLVAATWVPVWAALRRAASSRVTAALSIRLPVAATWVLGPAWVHHPWVAWMTRRP